MASAELIPVESALAKHIAVLNTVLSLGQQILQIDVARDEMAQAILLERIRNESFESLQEFGLPAGASMPQLLQSVDDTVRILAQNVESRVLAALEQNNQLQAWFSEAKSELGQRVAYAQLRLNLLTTYRLNNGTTGHGASFDSRG